MPFYDSVIVLSGEALKCHKDCFSEYAISMGKTSQGINQFKNHVQALTAGSKML
jgi:hypothetical protein